VKKTRVELFGLSPKAEEVRRVYKTHAMRENPLTATHLHATKLSEKVSPKVIPGGPRKLPKLPNQAAPINRVAITPKGDYVPGDGDFPTALRPGCDDHKKYKSLSTAGTVTYARSHV